MFARPERRNQTNVCYSAFWLPNTYSQVSPTGFNIELANVTPLRSQFASKYNSGARYFLVIRFIRSPFLFTLKERNQARQLSATAGRTQRYAKLRGRPSASCPLYVLFCTEFFDPIWDRLPSGPTAHRSTDTRS